MALSWGSKGHNVDERMRVKKDEAEEVSGDWIGKDRSRLAKKFTFLPRGNGKTTEDIVIRGFSWQDGTVTCILGITMKAHWRRAKPTFCAGHQLRL